MPTIHLPIGGSTAARTLGCPAWVEKSKNIPSRPPGQAAIDGSMHHEVMEMCQTGGTEPKDHLGFIYKEGGAEREFTADDLYLSELAYNATNDLMDELDIDELLIEPFVQYQKGYAGGSIDLLGLSADRKTLLILDYKFGRGVVAVENNAQLQFYAMCVAEDIATRDLCGDLSAIEYVIVQPQRSSVVYRWSAPSIALGVFVQNMEAAIEDSEAPTLKPTPGPHCKWCPAENYCEERRAGVLAATLLDAKSHNELCAAAGQLEEVDAWVKAMKEELYLQLNRGVKIDGWKIVDKKANRKWDDAEGAEAEMRKKGMRVKDIKKTALITAPQAVTLAKKNKVNIDLDPFIIKTSPGTTLAPLSDDREAVVVTDVTGHLVEMMDK